MSHNCKYYDLENGWCKKLSDWSDAMPDIEYCTDGPCPYESPKTYQVVVNTKYDVGDIIWYYNYSRGAYYPSPLPGKIDKISVEITKNNIYIYYHVEICRDSNKIYETYSENKCFNSFEECAKWCEEH